jgi:hypothetical protein
VSVRLRIVEGYVFYPSTVILFLLFTNDVTICMELDPGIHIGSTWFVLETGCDILTFNILAQFLVRLSLL